LESSPLKWLEQLAKVLGALFATLVLWRPWRRKLAPIALASARRVLLVRLDNRVGEALLMTPLISTLKRSAKGYAVDLLVHPKVARVLEGHPEIDRLIPFESRDLWMGPLAPEIHALRHRLYDAVVHCANWTAPSVSGSILARLVARDALVLGPARFPVAGLADVAVSPRPDTSFEVSQRLHLLSPLAPGAVSPALSFRTPKRRLSWEEGRRFAVVNPGGRLGWRRIPPAAFAAAARELERQGLHAVVTWGPGEDTLASQVAAAAPGSELAPPTDIDQLASLMAGAQMTVCNNTGPMHLSVAVGTPTLGLFLRMDMRRWGHAYPPHQMVDLTATVDSGGSLEASVTEAIRVFVQTLQSRTGPVSEPAQG
jgi:heptosyltransferase III